MSMPVRRVRAASVRPRGRQRRKLVWATRDQSGSTLAAGATARADLVNNLEVAGASTLGMTVARVHLALVINWTTTDATLGADVGILPSTTLQIASVVADTAVGEDWMLLTICPPALCPNTTLVGTNLTGGIRFDLRAKRKLDELNQHLYFVITNPGSGSITWGIRARTLCMLP